VNGYQFSSALDYLNRARKIYQDHGQVSNPHWKETLEHWVDLLDKHQQKEQVEVLRLEILEINQIEKASQNIDTAIKGPVNNNVF
jgi:wyosine [tRNA(Phe)-imidazoG37] synthetase (radical SAM superfamily)